jgi:hypothetical protein
MEGLTGSPFTLMSSMSLLLGDEVIDVTTKNVASDNIHLFAWQTKDLRGFEVPSRASLMQGLPCFQRAHRSELANVRQLNSQKDGSSCCEQSEIFFSYSIWTKLQ